MCVTWRPPTATYVVRDDGGLMRLPQSVDFLLPTSPVRMQFGDVPVDFTRVEQEAPEEPQPAVPDLFDYAVGEGRQEPDAADMSVDDILDLRAGEPTSMFQADSVKHRAQELDAAQHQTFEPFPFEQACGAADDHAGDRAGGGPARSVRGRAVRGGRR